MNDMSDELLVALPKYPDNEFDEWARKKIKANAIVYKVAWVPDYITGLKSRMIECRCTACGATFYQMTAYSDSGAIGFYSDQMEKIFSYESILCPNCGEEATAFHISKISPAGKLIQAECPIELTMVAGYPAILCWRYTKTISKQGQAIVSRKPCEAYIFAKRKTYKYVGWYKYFSTVVNTGIWEPRSRATDTRQRVYKENIYVRSGWNGTSMENAKIEQYIEKSEEDKCYPITYCRTFAQHPQIENLLVQCGAGIINELMEKNGKHSYYYGVQACIPCATEINWKSKKPGEMLGLNKEEFREFRMKAIPLNKLDFYKFMRDKGYPLSFDDARVFPLSEYEIKRILDLTGEDPRKVARYLDKQRRKRDKNTTATTYIDYIRMMQQLGMEFEKYPQDIVKAHDRAMELQQAKRDEKKRKEAKKNEQEFRQLAGKYAWMEYHADGMMIRIANVPDELFTEGQKLHHCVASYVGSHAKGERCIFFIRKEEAPEEPFYTLELNLETMESIQNRGKNNCKESSEVIAFKKEWLEFIKKGMMKNGNRNCA